MDSKLLVLRFRDPEETISTIPAHNSIIENFGAVRWGWWKKDTETLTSQEMEFVSRYNKEYVYLINRDLNKLYKATLSRVWDIPPDETQLHQVPSYYRSNVQKVYMWFVFTKIELVNSYSIDFDSQFAENGNPTYLISSPETPKKKDKFQRKSIKKNRILVLSDLHFGEDYAFCLGSELHKAGQTKDTLPRALHQDLKKLKIENEIGLLVITGDFTTKGDWSPLQRTNILTELHELCSLLNIDKKDIIAVPGNHDIIRNSPTSQDNNDSLVSNNVSKLSDNQFEMDFRTFVNQLNGREWSKNLSYNDFYHIEGHNINFDLTILNSCKIVSFKGMSEYGCVGIEGIDTIKDLKDDESESVQRIAFLHHHLLPVYDIESLDNKPSLSVDSVRILKNSLLKNIKLAVHGHQHKFSMAKYNLFNRSHQWEEKGITVIANGSTSVSSTRMDSAERNSYSILTIHSEGIDILVRELMHSDYSGVTVLEHTV